MSEADGEAGSGVGVCRYATSASDPEPGILERSGPLGATLAVVSSIVVLCMAWELAREFRLLAALPPGCGNPWIRAKARFQLLMVIGEPLPFIGWYLAARVSAAVSASMSIVLFSAC
jgi:hypothetical protein